MTYLIAATYFTVIYFTLGIVTAWNFVNQQHIDNQIYLQLDESLKSISEEELLELISLTKKIYFISSVFMWPLIFIRHMKK